MTHGFIEFLINQFLKTDRLLNEIIFTLVLIFFLKKSTPAKN
jgi:hypothetical protein